ncbi:MAG TPA: lysylphosphatidylglycerol synthase transmembrane domain-containing protein [Candidatus Accumulibacter phosphatis]|nr:lysylphosphatidylglycerol synthase transmembrane domain-containing protein [Candidatus Accumulibacter phosphatis]
MTRRRRLLLCLQFAVAGAALASVGAFVDWSAAARVWAAADLRWLAAACLVSLAGFVPAALRWSRLLAAVRLHYPFLAAYRAYLTGVFFGLAMPGVIAGDAARIWLCTREARAPLALATTTVIAERALGVAALLSILSLGIAIGSSGAVAGMPGWLFGIALLLAAGLVALPLCLRWLDARWTTPAAGRRWLPAAAVARLRATLGALREIGAADLLLAFVLSIAFQLVDIVAVAAVGRALAIDLSLPILLVTMPLVYLATVLPISPGGLGVREGTMALALAHAGVSSSAAALLALTVFLNRVVVGAIGGLAHLASGTKLTDAAGADRGRAVEQPAD